MKPPFTGAFLLTKSKTLFEISPLFFKLVLASKYLKAQSITLR
ncbi:hypothetical protein VCHENC02_3899 [Vibrio harveyi]|uniref:Uncharacterized protein n=1 Tax=Vibrio harveyi TaxID=669 RepID=A0A454CVB2_VIBHA|nr:hypothetical protein VCHENC02_3899 [Vibrio harveyi]